jgi:ribosomal protein S21
MNLIEGVQEGYAEDSASHKLKKEVENEGWEITEPETCENVCRVFKRELYNIESLHKCIQRTYTMF